MQSDIELRYQELLHKPIKTKEEIQEIQDLIPKLELALTSETLELLLELRGKAIVINSIWDLVNTRERYPTAIDILIRHLHKKYHDKNKEGIIRALGVREAKGKASSALIAEYNNTPIEKQNLRWTIGNAIFQTITEKDVESILSIVQNKKNGMSRQMFVAALGKVKSEIAEGVLIQLLDDKEVAPQALDALGRLKSQKAKAKIRLLTTDSNSLIRTEAQKALKKIEK